MSRGMIMANQSSRRVALGQIAPQQAQHAGLWFERMLPEIPRREKGERRGEGEGERRPPQAAHIAQTAAIAVPAAYGPAFRRWREALELRAEQLGAAASALDGPAYSLELREATVIGRMAVGLGAEGVLETAISLQRSYGLPQIPGSALKGTAAAYAHRYLDAKWCKGGGAHTDLFGDTRRAGLVTFYDALYVPGSSRRPLEPDTLTVHHPDYYQGGDNPQPPADWDSPTPIPFLSATGAYLIALEGPSDWVRAAYNILGLALAEIGVGAKTSSGYGRLRFGAAPAVQQAGASGAAPSQPAAPQPERETGAGGAAPANQGLKPASSTIPAVGEVVSGSLAGFLDSRTRREVRVKLNRVPPTVVGVVPARLVGGRTSGGLRARVVERVNERGTTYLYLEPVKA